MRRSKRPSEYRCLVGVIYAVLALIVAHGLVTIESAICGMLVRRAANVVCSVVPAPTYYALFAVALLCLAYTIYRAYRDFYCSDYYLDLAEAGYL